MWTDLLGAGLPAQSLTSFQVGARAVVVFAGTLLLVRLAGRRFMARMSAFDVVLGLVLASTLARAVNGTAAIGPTFVGGAVLVGLHRVLALIAYRSDAVGKLIKGDAARLVSHGVVDETQMRTFAVSQKDLLEEARLNGNVTDVSEIEFATMERSGEVSIVRRAGQSGH